MLTKNELNEQCITFSQMTMFLNSRMFWRRFATWTRAYIIGRYLGVGTEEELFSRLYSQTSSIGDMLQIIFERESSNDYSQLLNQFSITLRDLISAQIQGDTEAVNQNIARLYQNAEDRAKFLASIVSPYLNEAEWRNMLEAFNQYIIEEANSLITGNYSNDIELFGRLTDLTNKMGDSFTKALYGYITSGSQNIVSNPPQGNQQCITFEQMNQIYNMRMLWFELVTWVRAYMLSRYKGIGNPDEVKARLKQVPVEFVELLKQYFGEKAEPALQLINNYIDLIDALITAQSEGNTDEISRILQLLYQNADQIAELLASLNPFWNQNEWRNRFYNNLRSTIEESTTFLTGDNARNLDIFSSLLEQAENASGYFARGLFNYINSQNMSSMIK